jgi:hypothetical protein
MKIKNSAEIVNPKKILFKNVVKMKKNLKNGVETHCV